MTQRHARCPPRRAAAAAAVVALALLVPEVFADPIGYTVSRSNLYRLDLATLEFELIGPTGLSSVSSTPLAFHADGTLLGLTTVGLNSLRLASFDPATGAGQTVAELNVEVQVFDLYGFAADAVGGLWASGIYGDADGHLRGVIFALDAAGGTVGELVELGGLDFYGLAACGDLLVAAREFDGLVAIDPVTGASSVLFPEVPFVQDMDVGPDGGLWMVATLPIMPNPGYVHRLDLTTGELTTVGKTASLNSLAIAPPTGGPCVGGAPLSIPTLSPWALIALAVSLAVAALWIVRRRA